MVYLRVQTWEAVKQVALERKARGEKGVSASSVVDELVTEALGMP
jgi:hypothetical protein